MDFCFGFQDAAGIFKNAYRIMRRPRTTYGFVPIIIVRATNFISKITSTVASTVYCSLDEGHYKNARWVTLWATIRGASN